LQARFARCQSIIRPGRSRLIRFSTSASSAPVDEDITWDETLVIEDDVWIGNNVVILPGCKFIGRGSIIGAGSIVTRNVERYTVVAGNPARKLRDRFAAELVAQIEASRWWELDALALRALRLSQPDVLFRPNLENLSQFDVRHFKRGAR